MIDDKQQIPDEEPPREPTYGHDCYGEDLTSIIERRRIEAAQRKLANAARYRRQHGR